ncbi:MAG: hypothetical protein PUJ55_00585 [Clostridiales bacterium]|nr:hypothetical protein [Roseburia sp.]MDD7635414.1 hypothetical protein [Clostridiales bacterium]MDY4113949.1 hypothetical protein [Roseburia sp.]
MKNIITTYGILLVLLCNILICVQLVTASGQAAAAREYKADVIAEIENSNFNPNVIESCKRQAATAGYTLDVHACTYDEMGDIQTAEVILEYSYAMPIFGISDKKMTRGIAR